MPEPYDYSIFQDFIVKYLPQGFENINRDDPWVMDMNRKLARHRQSFYIADLLHMHIYFVSAGMPDLIAVEPDQFQLSTMMSLVHPKDFSHYSIARSMVIKRGYEALMRREGHYLISTHARIKDITGNFTPYLFQAYGFYSEHPHRTVYALLVLTDISDFTLEKHGYHYYEGGDMSMFRYPDEALLQEGHLFSDREFEILKLIAAGYGSEQIADKLSLSVNTVNTHRRNILQKTKKSTTHDLVIELRERGML
jgi:DNA-binding CsgD family transcriptional regulator